MSAGEEAPRMDGPARYRKQDVSSLEPPEGARTRPRLDARHPASKTGKESMSVV